MPRERVWRKIRNRRKPAAAFSQEDGGSPSPAPRGAPKRAPREEQARRGYGRGQGRRRSLQGVPTQDLRSPRSPSASAPTPDSGSPRWEPDQSCRLNALCALYPGSRRCPSAWRSVVPWRSQAREGQDLATFGGPGRAWVLRTPPPGRAERVLPMRSRKHDESPAGPGNPLGHWPLAGAINVKDDNEQATCLEP